MPDHRVTHFAWPVRLPANCPALLRVTAPKLRPDELVDRLVLTSVHLPRRHRIAGLARRQRRLQGHRMPVPAKLAAYGVISGLPPDKVLIDIGDKLHGTGPLAQSIYDESQAYEASSSKCNWVNSQPGVDWKTGQPSNPVYVWSDKTKDNLGPPLRSAAAAEQERSRPGEPALVGAGRITQVPMMIVPAAARRLRDAPEGVYTVKEVTPQSGVEHSFSYDPATATATVSVKNYYLRWLQISVDQYGRDGETVGSTQYLGCSRCRTRSWRCPCRPTDRTRHVTQETGDRTNHDAYQPLVPRLPEPGRACLPVREPFLR